MKNAFAFIVGIERYDQPNWDVTGPGANAVSVAEWCLAAGMPPQNVILFLEADGAPGAALSARGVILEESAKLDAIDTFFRTGLAKGRPENSRLLVFWSGHGFVDKDGTRVFICRDYTAAAMTNRVFNASALLRYLRSEDFTCFSDQIFVADVCGVQSNKLQFSPDRSNPERFGKFPVQAAYFATPEGKYALGAAGRGVFTEVVLGVLNQFKGWPGPNQFVEAMDSAFRGAGETPFRVSVFNDTLQDENRLVGTIPVADKGPHYQSLVSSIAFTGDHNKISVGSFEPIRNDYLDPGQVYGRVGLDHFTGREWLARRVDAFLAKHDRGYLIIEAEAGLGKSTFLAWLALTRDYVHHFCELDPGVDGIGRSLRSLAVQVVRASGLDLYEVESIGTGAVARPDAVRSLLERAVTRRGQPLILIIDALDEAGTPPRQNVLGLPTVLPRGVYVIASQRPVPVTLSTDRATTPREVITIAAGSEDNRRDMERYLQKVASWPGVAQARAAGGVAVEPFVETLAAKCQGVWIYLRYVIHEIEEGLRSPLDLRSLPEGMTGYYLRHWRARHDADPSRWYAVELPLLATLAAGREVLPLDWLLDWSGADSTVDGARTLLEETWRPFLLVVGREATARYSVYHATLRDFFSGRVQRVGLAAAELAFVDRLSEATLRAHGRIAERLLAAWGGLAAGLPDLRACGRDERTRYGLRNLGEHLEAAGRVAELHRLLGVKWGSQAGGAPGEGATNAWHAAWEREGDPLAYQAEIDRAWRLADEAAEETGDTSTLALQFRYALLTASQRSVINRLWPKWFPRFVEAGLWSIDQALACARRLPNPVRRSSTLRRLAGTASRAERPAILAEALTAAMAVPAPLKRLPTLLVLIPRLPPALRASGEEAALALVRDQYDEHDPTAFYRAMLRLLGVVSGPRLERALLMIRATAMGRYGPDLRRPRSPAGREARSISQALEDIEDRLERFEEFLWAIGDVPLYNVWGLVHALAGQVGSLPEARFRRLARSVGRSYRIWEVLDRGGLGLATPEERPRSRDRAREVLIALRYMIFSGESAFLDGVFAVLDELLAQSSHHLLVKELSPLLRDGQLGRLLGLIKRFNPVENYPKIIVSQFKFRMLRRIAAFLTPRLACRALEIAESLEEPDAERARQRVGGFLPIPDCVSYLSGYLERSRCIDDRQEVARSLVVLASALPGSTRDPILDRAWRLYQSTADDNEASEATLRAMAPHLTPPLLGEAIRLISTWYFQVQFAFRGLAPHLAGPLLKAAWSAALTYEGPYAELGIDKATFLVALAPRFPEPERAGRLREALRTVRAVEPESERGGLLVELASYYPPSRRDGLLREALRDFASLEADFSVTARGCFLECLPHLPAGLMEEAFRAFESIADPAHRGEVQSAILMRQESLRDAQDETLKNGPDDRPPDEESGAESPGGELSEPAAVAEVRRHMAAALRARGNERMAAIETAAAHLERVLPNYARSAWREWLHAGGEGTRKRLLRGLESMSAAARRLGGPAAMEGLVAAVEDVARWMP